MMKIPNTGRKKVLFVVDMQTTFILERNTYIIPRIKKILENVSYDLVIFSLQKNDTKSLRFTQIGWKDMCESDSIDREFSPFFEKENTYIIEKIARSAFKSLDTDVKELLGKYGIEEVHITGTESNDCVMATALESADLGYFTFVIEEATETGHTAENHTRAIGILNYLNLTNNSNFVGRDKTEFYKIEI